SLNHKNIFIKSDYLFFSNEKRFEEFYENYKKKEIVIITSNLKSDNSAEYIIDYNCYSKHSQENLSSEILLNVLEEHKNVEEIYLAGLDGYLENKKNYYFDALDSKNIEEINSKVKEKIKKISKKIVFLTKSIYEEKK
ncbi:MAG: hypothetical protein ACRCZO_12240, partial [Cetobacterium sp.]